MGKIQQGPWRARKNKLLNVTEMPQEFLGPVHCEDKLVIKGWDVETLLLVAILLGVSGVGIGVIAIVMAWVR